MKSTNTQNPLKLHVPVILRAMIFAIVISFMTPAMLFATTTEHIVQPGETLLQIAVDYDVTIAALLQVNRLYNADIVQVGQTIIIPSVGSDLSDSTTGGELKTEAVEPEIEAEQTSQIDATASEKSSASPYITVQPGETLSQIALRYGTNSRALMALNGLSNPNLVRAGEQLRVANEDGEVTLMEDMLPTWDSAQIHVVQAGESLGQIAELYGVKVSTLLSFNDLYGMNWVEVGQELRIPKMPNLNLVGVDYANAPPPGTRLLEVDLTEQWMTAWEGKKVFMHTLISSGMPDTPTVLGRYAIYDKREKQDMNGFNGPLPDVPWVMYFFDGFSFHGAYWHNNFGIPMSHGCVHLTPEQAKELYEWADVGTEVYVHW